MKIDLLRNLFPLLFLSASGLYEYRWEKFKHEQTGNNCNRNSNFRDNHCAEHKQHQADFVPQGYNIFEEINGDLNDGIADKILIIKGTSKDEFFKDEYRGELTETAGVF